MGYHGHHDIQLHQASTEDRHFPIRVSRLSPPGHPRRDSELRVPPLSKQAFEATSRSLRGFCTERQILVNVAEINVLGSYTIA
jgi:hypothetical protein